MPDPKLFAYLLLGLNSVALILFGYDKLRSKSQNARRIPEKTLLFAAALAASPGALIAMVLFNHKTSKPKFRYGIPALLVVHAGLGYWLAYY